MKITNHSFYLITLFFLGILSLFSQNKEGFISKTHICLENTEVWNLISHENKLKEEYQYLDNLNFYDISYFSQGQVVWGFLAEPKIDSLYPVIIFNRGGNRSYGELNTGAMIINTAKLASEGFVILASNYRIQDEFGGAEINDIFELIKLSEKIPKANPYCLGMYGASRGGMMNYLVMKKSDQFETSVVLNAPSDLFENIKRRPKMETHVFAECIPNYYDCKNETLVERSVYFWPEKLSKNTSLLLLIGKNDKRVHPNQSRKLARKLDSLNYNYKLKEFETNHFFSDKRELLNQEITNWFLEKLK